VYEDIWTFTFLNLSDISTTLYALNKGAYEANPIARFLISKLGLKALFVFKYFAMALSLLYYVASGNNAVIWTWNVVLGLVTAWNSYICYVVGRRGSDEGR